MQKRLSAVQTITTTLSAEESTLALIMMCLDNSTLCYFLCPQLCYYQTLFRFNHLFGVLSSCIICNNCNLTKQCEDRLLMNTHCHYVGQDTEQRTYTIELWASEFIL